MTTPAERTLTALAAHSRETVEAMARRHAVARRRADTIEIVTCPDCDSGQQCYDYSRANDETPTDRYATCPRCDGSGTIDEPPGDFIRRLCCGEPPDVPIAIATAVLTELELAAGDADCDAREAAMSAKRAAQHQRLADTQREIARMVHVLDRLRDGTDNLPTDWILFNSSMSADRCTHPDHVSGTTCEERAMSCRAGCVCCNGTETLASLADQSRSDDARCES